MCYGCADPPPALCPFHDNWLLAVADAFAVGGRLLDQPQLLTGYGRTLFLDGAANPFYLGSPISYHSAKELVNEVGFGGAFMDAYFGMNRLVLRDGFESGDLGAWSTAAP